MEFHEKIGAKPNGHEMQKKAKMCVFSVFLARGHMGGTPLKRPFWGSPPRPPVLGFFRNFGQSNLISEFIVSPKKVSALWERGPKRDNDTT